MKNNDTIYMVSYKDDEKRKHITFVKGFSQVKFLEDRFGEISFEPTNRHDEIKYDEVNTYSIINSLYFI